MNSAKTEAATPNQAPPSPVVMKQPEGPAKAAGPQHAMSQATGSAATPPHGGSAIMQAADMLSGQQRPNAGARASMMRTLQRSVGNNRVISLTNKSASPISRAPATNTICRQCGCENGGSGSCAGCGAKQLQRQANEAGPRETSPSGAAASQQLTVSHPEDAAEKEAEAVARQVTSGQDAPAISRFASGNVHTLSHTGPGGELARANSSEADNDADTNIAKAGHAISHKGSGSPVDSSLRRTLEPRMGADLSAARVHRDHNANEAAGAINARAFTHGNDIFLARGESDRDAHLMAHELTHVVQQSPESTVARAKKPTGKAEVELPVAPGVLELKGMNEFPGPILQFLQDHTGSDVIVNARFGKLAEGPLTVKMDRKGNFTVKPQPLRLSHPLFARAGEAAAALELSLIVESNKNNLRGYIGPAAAAKARNSKALNTAIEKAPDLIGLAGFSVPDLKLTNKYESGQLQLGVDSLPVKLGAAFSGTITLAVIDESVRIEGNAKIVVKGLAEGALELKRNEETGLVTGKAKVDLQLPANFKGAVDVAWDGQAISGEGKVGYTGEKLSGELTIKLMEKGEAAQLEKEKKAPSEESADKPGAIAAAPAKKPKHIDYVVFGEGDLNFAFNEWLNGTAHVIVDPKGFVTIIGKITPQKEYELFEQKDFVKQLFKFEARASYGIPVVGNIFIFGNLSMDAFAKLGPAKFYNIVVEGTYSTDPEKNKDFSIKGSINISAAAGLRMRAEAGAGLEILSHDIKAGAGINGIAGIKAYAEATPVIGYREKGAPGEDKKGEFYIRGDLEIAGQPFLGLSGDLFIELSTPWWSPLSDDKWTWPLFDKEYPIGGTLGVLASVDYVFGSKQWPAIEFKPVEFDSSKFMTDLYHDKTKPKSAEPEQKPSEWKEKNEAAAAPPTGDNTKGNATPGKPGELPPAKPTVNGAAPKQTGKPADPNARTAEGKSVKELQEEAEKKGKKPDGPAPKGDPEKSPDKKDEIKEPAAVTTTAELPLSMTGTTHKLILAPGKLEMESKRDLLSNKVGRAVGRMIASDGNKSQIAELQWIGKVAKDVQKEAIAIGKNPKKNLGDTPRFAELKGLIEDYGRRWKERDIEEDLAEATTKPAPPAPPPAQPPAEQPPSPPTPTPTPPTPTPPTPAGPPAPPPTGPTTPAAGPNTCADPLGSFDFEISVPGYKRPVTVKVADKRQKHTKMAQRTVSDMVRIARVANCASLTQHCEQEFCTAVRAGDKEYGSQIDRNTRRRNRYQALLEQAFQYQTPPKDRDEWDLFAQDEADVGFDVSTKGPTTKYRVKTNVTMSGTVLTGTHLFPEG